jgi:hypothetical protein
MSPCDQCGCHHTEEVGEKCPWRPPGGPKEFKGWSVDYLAGLPIAQAGAIKYRMADVERTHPAYLDSAQREQFWKKVEEKRK